MTGAQASVPNGISIGTHRFCIDFANGTNACQKYPVDVVKLLRLPGPITTLLKDDFGSIQGLQDKVVGLLRVADYLIATAATLMMFVYNLLFTSFTCIKVWRRENGDQKGFTRLKQWSTITLAAVSGLLLVYPVTALWLVHSKIEGLFSPAVEMLIHYVGGPAKDYVLSSLVLFFAASIPTYVAFWARHEKNIREQGEIAQTDRAHLTEEYPSGIYAGTKSDRDSVAEGLKPKISAPILEHAGPGRLTRVTDSVQTIARESHVQVGRLERGTSAL